MSILGGLVDEHREMELSPSSRLVRSSRLARHMWAILALCAAAVAFLFAL